MMKIRMLNDDFRRSFQGGRICLTQGVAMLPEAVKARILNKVRFFDDFTEENDPYSEHDFGSFQVDGSTIFFKIDYYDEQCQSGPDPAAPEKTTRVLTILKSEEW